MKNLRLLFILSTTIILGMIACKKGDTGPVGPRGPAGPDSVVYSKWITLSTTYNPADSFYEQKIAAPSITQSILDSGVVLTYLNFKETNGTYHVVPVSSLSFFLSEDYTIGSINISSNPDLTGFAYRYVTIPGSKAVGNKASGAIKGYTIQELKGMSYEEVQKVVGD